MIPASGRRVHSRPVDRPRRAVGGAERSRNLEGVDRCQRSADRRRLVARVGQADAGGRIAGRRVRVAPGPDAPLYAIRVLGRAARGDRTVDAHGPGARVHDGKPLRRRDVRLGRDLVLGDGGHHAVGVDAAIAEEGIPAGPGRVALGGNAKTRALGVIGGREEVEVVSGCRDELVDLFRRDGAAFRHAAGAVQRPVVRDHALSQLVAGG